MFLQGVIRRLLIGLITVAMVCQTNGVVWAQSPSEAERRDRYLDIRSELDRMNRVFTYVADQMDASVFDVAAMAQKLGPDPSDAFAFVRDLIGYRAYYGSLRGPDGVLVDRLGNSLDRALLLSEILSRNGHEVRLVHTTLEDSIAEVLAMRSFEPAPKAPQLLELTPEMMSVFLNEGGLTAEQVKEALRLLEEQSTGLRRDLTEIIEPNEDEILKTLSAFETEMPKAPGPDDLKAEAREHFWVQLRRSNNRWLDLDPSFKDSVAGESFQGDRTFFDADALPPALIHRVSVNVVLSTVENGKKIETPVINQELEVPDLVGKSISLVSMPISQKSPSSGAASLQDLFAVALQVDGETLQQQLYDLKGRLFDKPPELKDAARSGFAAAMSALDQSTSPSQSPDVPGGRLTGLTVYYTQIDSLGLALEPTERLSVRKYLDAWNVASWDPEDGADFDLKALTAEEMKTQSTWWTQLALFPADISPDYSLFKSMSYLRDAGDFFDNLLRREMNLPTDDSVLSGDQSLPWLLYAVAAGSSMTNLGVATPSNVLSRYLSRSSLFALELQVIEHTGSEARYRQTIDLMTLGDRFAVNTGNSEALAHQASMRLGVGLTALERLVLEAEAEALEQPGQASRNATHVFEDAREGHYELAHIPRDRPDEIDKLALPDNIKLELAISNRSGQILVLIAPGYTSTDAFAWWASDFDSGAPIGRMVGQRGTSAVEYGIEITTKVLLAGYVTYKCYSAQKEDAGVKPGIVLCVIAGGLAAFSLIGWMIGATAKYFKTAASVTAIAGVILNEYAQSK